MTYPYCEIFINFICLKFKSLMELYLFFIKINTNCYAREKQTNGIPMLDVETLSDPIASGKKCEEKIAKRAVLQQ